MCSEETEASRGLNKSLADSLSEEWFYNFEIWVNLDWMMMQKEDIYLI